MSSPLRDFYPKSKDENVNKWNEAIVAARKQINELRFAIKVFIEYRNAGFEWPGDAITHEQRNQIAETLFHKYRWGRPQRVRKGANNGSS